MSWVDAAIGGGVALAGVGMQQAFSWRSDQRRYVRDQWERRRQEQHLALVDVVKSGRRVQRALVDFETGEHPAEAKAAFARGIDQLTEALAAIRLLVTDQEVLEEADSFEGHAKELERSYQRSDQGTLHLTPLIDAIRRLEGTA